ncbi:PspC domain-containing protein [Catellatospora bangladeshensis]
MLDTVSGNLSAAGVEETLKDFWASRPRRPHQGRKIAGVAAGLAERYRVDPVVVRVAFVAMALCNGAGVLIYLLGWLWLAQEGDEVSAAESLIGRGRSSTPVALTVVLGLAVLPATGFFVDGGFTMVGGVLLSVGAVYLLHRSRGSLNRPPVAPEVSPVHTTGSPTTRETPPAWDPLGAAPFAWDLPAPAPVPAPVGPPRPPRPRWRFGGVAFGLALVVLAGSLVASSYSAWFTAPHVIGLVVATLAAGLLVGAVRGGGRGLIPLVVPLSVVGVAMTAADFGSFDGSDHVGDVTARPTAAEQVLDRYDTNAGEVDLDLTGLPAAGEVRTEVEVGVGSIRVRVPAGADVVATCHTGIGSLECLGTELDGRDRTAEVTDRGADGPGGLELGLDIRAGVGKVVLVRG